MSEIELSAEFMKGAGTASSPPLPFVPFGLHELALIQGEQMPSEGLQ